MEFARPAELVALLGTAGLDAAALIRGRPGLIAELDGFGALPAPGEPYGRRVLHRDLACEILVVRWREGAFCLPHTHGRSDGEVHLLRGRFIERSYRAGAGQLVKLQEKGFESPSTLRLQGGAIHDMMATGDGLGLHCYRPAIEGMVVFDTEHREALTVTSDCGAWRPQDVSLIVERAPWPT